MGVNVLQIQSICKVKAINCEAGGRLPLKEMRRVTEHDSRFSSFFTQNRSCSPARKDTFFYGERANKPGVKPGSFPGPAAGVQQFQAECYIPACLW